MEEKKKNVLEKITNNKKIDVLDWLCISLEDLLTTNENGITYLECLINNGVDFDYKIKKEIGNSLEALYICAKNNKIDWLWNNCNEDLFFKEVEGNKKLIEYILENNVKTSSLFFPLFKKHTEIIDYLQKYNVKDEFTSLSNDIITKLFIKNEDGYLYDKYKDNPFIRKMALRKAPKELFVSYCIKNNDYELLKEGNESVLLYDIGNGKKVIDELFDKGYIPSFNWYTFESKELLDKLIEKKRFDLLYNAELPLLLSEYNDGDTYLDLMIEKHNEGIDVHLEQMAFDYICYPSEMTADLMLALARNDLQGYIPDVNINMLLYKSTSDRYSVIEYLINKDKDITKSKLLPLCYKNDDPKLAVILRNMGVDDTQIKHSVNEMRLVDQIIKSYNDDYSKDCVSLCPNLLLELKELFYNDEISNKNLIDDLIVSYKYLTSIENPKNSFFIKELEQLIEIKKHNPDRLLYVKGGDCSYFSESKGVVISDSFISTINHETSHALHYYLANNIEPDNYNQLIEKIRNNPNNIKRIEEYSNRFLELKRTIKSQISKSKINEYYDNLYQGNKLMDLHFFLNKSKEEQKERFKDDYNEQVLDTILARSFSIDEFIKQRTEIEIDEMVDATFRNDFGALIAIGDIIDAIYLGKFKNGIVYNDKGLNIKPAYGHGINYYRKGTKGFLEMIANYGSIIKSKDSDAMIEYLRYIVGDELVDTIKDVYENKIINSNIYIKDNIKGDMVNGR